MTASKICHPKVPDKRSYIFKSNKECHDIVAEVVALQRPIKVNIDRGWAANFVCPAADVISHLVQHSRLDDGKEEE